MKFIFFSASLFYLLGLKLSTQIQVRPVFLHKPATIEQKSVQENKVKNSEYLVKPETIAKDTAISARKANQQILKSGEKSAKSPSSGKGSV